MKSDVCRRNLGFPKNQDHRPWYENAGADINLPQRFVERITYRVNSTDYGTGDVTIEPAMISPARSSTSPWRSEETMPASS